MGNYCAKWCPCCTCCLSQASRKPRTVTPNIALPDVPASDKTHPNHKFMGNKIKTAKYTPWDFIPLNLFKQFHAWTNWYFLFVVVINFIPAISAFGNYISWIPLAAVLLSTAIKDAIEDYQRTKLDRRLNNTFCRIYRNGQYECTTWERVSPGDVLRVQCNEAIPADLLVLSSSDVNGVCFVETANLDGESNLKQREVLRCFQKTRDFQPESLSPYRVLIEAPNAEVYRINGTFYREEPPSDVNVNFPTEAQQSDDDSELAVEGRIGSPRLRNEQVPVNKENVLLRGCKLRNTDFVEGLVLYAGHETKVMLNDDGPRFKRSRLELRIQQDTIYCGILLFIMCTAGAVGQAIWQGNVGTVGQVPFLAGLTDQYDSGTQGVITFFIFVIYLQSLIPLPLFVSQELVKILQIHIMENDVELYHEPSNRRLVCRAWNLSEDLGQIQYVFTDKTGTLTENVMTFRRCVINGVDYAFDDPRLDSEDGEKKSGCSIHQTVTGEAPCPQCSTNVPELRSLNREILRMSLVSLLDQAQTQLTTAGSYSQQAMPTSSLSSRVNDSNIALLHHFILMMAVCNTVVVSATSHHETDNQDPFSPRMEKPKQKRDGLHLDAESTAFTSEVSLGRSRVGSGDKPSKGFTNAREEQLRNLLESYEAESTDELALVKAACLLGCRLLNRTNNLVSVTLPGESTSVEFRVLRVLPFDSDRKRMSIIVQHPINKTVVLYCKGADTSILPLLNRQYDQARNPTLVRTRHIIDEYAKLGLRTLCFAKRVLSNEEYAEWSRMYEAAECARENRAARLNEVIEMVETHFTLLGAVGIEDRLQDLVPETIQSLRRAGMHVWMLTGDKQETAVNIGYSCHLLDSGQKLLFLNESDAHKTTQKINFYLQGVKRMKEKLAQRQTDAFENPKNDPNATTNEDTSKKSIRKLAEKKVALALVIDGGTLKHVLDSAESSTQFIALASQCKSVLCCRTTPLQKGSIVKLVMEKLGKYALAVGDGANDVSMIKTANVGIGITGREGLQASMASDYTIAKFKYLKRLLLVHGHWSYHRFAMMALIIFFKQMIWTMVFFWFQVFNGFSAIVMIDQLYQVGYTLIMTAAPPIYIGLLDQVVKSKVLMDEPELYLQSRKGLYYQPMTFWVYLADGLYQSLVVFFIAFAAYTDSTYGIWEFGVLCYFSAVTTVLVVCSIEVCSWTWIGLVCVGVSYLGTWLCALIYNAVCVTCMPPDNPYWVLYNHAQTIEFWFIQMASIVISVLPRVIMKIIRSYFQPNVVVRARIRNYVMEAEEKKKPTSDEEAANVKVEQLPVRSRSVWGNLKRIFAEDLPVTKSTDESYSSANKSADSTVLDDKANNFSRPATDQKNSLPSNDVSTEPATAVQVIQQNGEQKRMNFGNSSMQKRQRKNQIGIAEPESTNAGYELNNMQSTSADANV